MKNVLIICYSFPPNPGVGGRRWAKFAKYLAQEKYKVHVVSNFNTSNTVSEWSNDVLDEQIINHTQNVFYPNDFLVYPKTYLKKIIYRFWLFFFKLFSKGALYDRAFFWKKTMLTKVDKIITENNINNIVVSGPPFRLLYYAALLKNKLSHINLIIDMRDPWTDNTSFLGFDKLSKKRLDFEKKMERFVFEKANYVVSVNDYLTKIYEKKYPQLKNKFLTIPNGFDPDELDIIQTKEINSQNELNFVLAGSLYPDLEYIFIPFLNYLKNNIQNFNSKINFHFYGNIDEKLKKIINQYQLDCIKLHGFQKMSYVKLQLIQANCCMMFTAPNHASNFNTKFYEYISLRKPIFHFSNDGEISNVIVTNNIGFAIKPNTFDLDFTNALNLICNNKFVFNNDYNINEFNIKYLTKKMEALFV